MTSNTGASSHFYPHHRKSYVCGKNSPGAPVFIAISTLITKSYYIIKLKFGESLEPIRSLDPDVVGAKKLCRRLALEGLELLVTFLSREK